MEPLGTQIRRRRKDLGLTIGAVSLRTGVSKPYLSLIETNRVKNPPSDAKLRQLEQALGFSPGELVGRAHWQRTPPDVRAMLTRLLGEQQPAAAAPAADPAADPAAEPPRLRAVPIINEAGADYPSDFTDLGYPPRHAVAYVGCSDVEDPDAFAARVVGDAMAPRYGEGDLAIFCPAATARDGDDCFVRFADGRTTFRRIFFEQSAAGGAIRLQPRNERHRPQNVAAEEVAGLYRAAYRVERVDGRVDGR